VALLVFGNGDGGGGPLAKMLENVSLSLTDLRQPIFQLLIPQLRRIRATTNQARELPPVSMGSSVDEFFEYVDKSTTAGKKLPNW
jgi:alpha-mannosidase